MRKQSYREKQRLKQGLLVTFSYLQFTALSLIKPGLPAQPVPLTN